MIKFINDFIEALAWILVFIGLVVFGMAPIALMIAFSPLWILTYLFVIPLFVALSKSWPQTERPDDDDDVGPLPYGGWGE